MQKQNDENGRDTSYDYQTNQSKEDVWQKSCTQCDYQTNHRTGSDDVRAETTSLSVVDRWYENIAGLIGPVNSKDQQKGFPYDDNEVPYDLIVTFALFYRSIVNVERVIRPYLLETT